MNARVALSAVFSLAVLVASLPSEADVRVKRSAAPPWSLSSNNYAFSGRAKNKFEQNRGPPGGFPPGLAGGGPPGLSGGSPGHGGGPPGKNKPGKGPGKPNYNSGEGEPSIVMPDDGANVNVNVNVNSPYVNSRVDGADTDNESSSRAPIEEQPRICRKNELRCGSGECLPESVRCDNKFDCRDSSDERGCVTNRNPGVGCVLPEQPEGGSYALGGCGEPCSKRPGDKVPTSSILTYTCRDNYILNGSLVSVCVDEIWHNQPSCHRPCPPLTSTTVNIVCTYQGSEVSCTEQIKPGTEATLSCKSHYNLPVTNDPGYRKITCLEDGLWDRRVFRCLPVCGIPVSHGTTLVVNGFEAKVGLFPWHVGIYSKKGANVYEQICGGSLISNSLVVSAAHCFYDEVYNKVSDKSQYYVAAGKHYRDWYADENYVQKTSVAELLLPVRYIGFRGNFAEDIALIKLASPFELSSTVRPICIDWDNVYERKQLQLGQSGKAVGWGKTITGEPSATLQEISMPFIPYGQCLSAVPDNFRGYITSDKFCAGRLNGSNLCDGDSGGGLCFEMDGRWYLRGIVSASPVKDNTCDHNAYTVFTSTGYFRDWIRETYVTT